MEQRTQAESAGADAGARLPPRKRSRAGDDACGASGDDGQFDAAHLDCPDGGTAESEDVGESDTSGLQGEYSDSIDSDWRQDQSSQECDEDDDDDDDEDDEDDDEDDDDDEEEEAGEEQDDGEDDEDDSEEETADSDEHDATHGDTTESDGADDCGVRRRVVPRGPQRK